MSGDAADPDYYAILGIEPVATRSEIRRAWRLLALRWHPDRAGDAATARFQELHAAYMVLSDPATRGAYDRRRGAVARGSQPRPPRAMLARLSGPLNALLACGVAHRVDDETIELHLNAEEAAQGGIVSISMRVPVQRGDAVSDELYSAWLTVPPGAADEAILVPSVLLRGMVHGLRFRLRVRHEDC
jgi:curved DNA-binding protein CbpA